MLIKLVNATADLLKESGYTRLELQLDSTGGHEATYYTAEGQALRALPVSDGWEDIATEPAGLIEAIMNAGPIGGCNINERNASDIMFEISEYMKAKKGE